MCLDSEMIEPRSKGGTLVEGKISRGRETLRLRSKGPATVEEMVSLYFLTYITAVIGQDCNKTLDFYSFLNMKKYFGLFSGIFLSPKIQ